MNYQPRRSALYWWQNFDAGEVREDFALIRELGLTKVRVLLMWDDFQPAPDLRIDAGIGQPAHRGRLRRGAGVGPGCNLLHRARQRAELAAVLAAGRTGRAGPTG